jgi:hypothetical protein
MKYRRKPGEIEAFLLGEILDFPDWWRVARDTDKILIHQGRNGHVWYTVETSSGKRIAQLGEHYIVKREDGEIAPVRKDMFEIMYEAVSEQRD